MDPAAAGPMSSRAQGSLGSATRVRTLDGTLQLLSPDGEPTVLQVEIPCAV
jgi:hypothetical protein